MVSCGLRLSEVGLAEFRKPQVSFLSRYSNSSNFKAEERAAADRVDWRKIYGFIYKCWHTRRPLFPDLDTMASLMEQDP